MMIISCDCCKRVLTADEFAEYHKGFWALSELKDVCKTCLPLLEARMNEAYAMVKEFQVNLITEAVAKVVAERRKA